MDTFAGTDIKMKGSAFTGCELRECYFQNSFLVEVDFSGSTFRETLFSNANLEKASFVGAQGYSIDPRGNKVRKAVFSVPEVLSLLGAFEIVIKDG